MSNQTKVGLLLGLGVVLLVGIIVSDHLATQSQNHITDAGATLATLGNGNPTNQPQDLRPAILGGNSGRDAAYGLPAAPVPNQLPPIAIGSNPAPTVPQPAWAVTNTPGNATAQVPVAPIPAGQPQLVGNGQTPAQQQPPVVAIPQPTTPVPPAPRTYTIKEGDTLSSIAAATLGSRNRWKDILDANTRTLGNAKSLKIGTQLVIPESEAKSAPAVPAAPTAPLKAARTYTVGKGDLLGAIAAKTMGSTRKVKELVAANRKALPQGEKTVLKTGLVLTIPAQ